VYLTPGVHFPHVLLLLQQSVESMQSSGSSAGSNSSGTYGTLGRPAAPPAAGLADMMDEMTKTLARRRAAAERKEKEVSIKLF
jgi:hypothetical protein